MKVLKNSQIHQKQRVGVFFSRSLKKKKFHKDKIIEGLNVQQIWPTIFWSFIEI